MLRKRIKEDIHPFQVLFERTLEKGSLLQDRFREILEEDSSLSPEIVDGLLGDLDAHKKVDTDGCIQLLYAALEHFVSRFAKEPVLRNGIGPLLARLEALEAREADEFEAEYVARLRVKPGEIRDLYTWDRDLLGE